MMISSGNFTCMENATTQGRWPATKSFKNQWVKINSESAFLVFIPHSAAASGWAGWAFAHLEFGSSVNPITTRGADYAHHITASPPRFGNPAASLNYSYNLNLI